MILRKFGKIIRGNATPFQLICACVLASMLGFVPGLAQGPGLILMFAALLTVLNANLGVAALVGIAAKLVSFLLTPAAFSIGRLLLDGPTQPVFVGLINAPVLAWFGFEYYTTIGGLVFGLIFGLVTGALLVKSVNGYRRKIQRLEAGSEKFRNYSSNRSVRFLAWLLLGGSSKHDYQALLSKRFGNPIRPIGAVLVVLSFVLAFTLQKYASEPIVRLALKNGLERVNGATVDIDTAELNLEENRLSIHGLAMADPNQLDTDLLRATAIEADISGLNLLRKRLQFDNVIVSDASTGEIRSRPGARIGTPPKPTEVQSDELPDAKRIEDYIEDAKLWKQRLTQVRQWLEKIAGPGDEDKDATEESSESLEDQLRRQVEELGYARVRADHLIVGHPTLTVANLLAEKVRVAQLEDETLDIQGKNLSTHPRLLSEKPELSVTSSRGTLALAIILGSHGSQRTPNQLSFKFNGLQTNALARNLKFDGTQPLQGGTMDISFDGTWSTAGGITVDLPLDVTLHNAKFSLPQLGSKSVNEVKVPIQVKGPLDNPGISVNAQQLSASLAKAGLSKAADELTKRASNTLKKELDEKLGTESGESLTAQGRKLLDKLLPAQKDKKE